ncbi:RF-1 domain-containing protein [Ganoderma leucocontextum]|nr:RF-1 domain-containing protein [Ganoderma leucocontextum]
MLHASTITSFFPRRFLQLARPPLRTNTSLHKGPRRSLHSGQDVLPTPPRIPALESAAESAEARSWIEKFKTREIPKTVVEFTYSRSSGPGGQNVNKVNTKATLRCPIDAPWIPQWARDYIKKTPAYASSSQSILLTSTVFRSQAQNVQDCLAKLHALVVSAASAGLINEPSKEQRERVRQLEKSEKARRRLEKDKRTDVKRSRSRRGEWD